MSQILFWSEIPGIHQIPPLRSAISLTDIHLTCVENSQLFSRSNLKNLGINRNRDRVLKWCAQIWPWRLKEKKNCQSTEREPLAYPHRHQATTTYMLCAPKPSCSLMSRGGSMRHTGTNSPLARENPPLAASSHWCTPPALSSLKGEDTGKWADTEMSYSGITLKLAKPFLFN